MELSNIIQIASRAVVAMFNIIIVLIALRKKKEAKTNEEETKMNDIINDQLNMAISNIKTLYATNNLMYNAKQTSKIAKKIIKKEGQNIEERKS